MSKEKELHLRRFAVQIAQQLPEKKAEALLVLGYVRELVAWQTGEAANQVTEILTQIVS